MIVKNEERTLARCLDSVGELADQIITVDTGSSDATAGIAAGRGATVIPFDFTTVDFAAARNQGLARASGDWILVLDADETLDPASRSVVRELVTRNENAGYYLERLNYRRDSGSTTIDYVVRLFRNRGEWRYRGRVHETIDASILAGGGRLLSSQARLHHEFVPDAGARRRRNLQYVEILLEEIAANPRDVTRFRFIAAECHQLGLFAQEAQVLEHITRMTPLNPEAHLHLGASRLLFGNDPERARLSLLKAVHLRPGYAEAESLLSLIAGKESAAFPPRRS